MSLHVVRAGLLSTLQGRARDGLRHMGVPSSGPADLVSLALANRLVGNCAFETGLEVLMGGLCVEVGVEVSAGLAGAPVPVSLNGQAAAFGEALALSPGDRLELGRPEHGTATYIALAGGITAREVLGSASTYLPARLGGQEGRALAAGDVLELQGPRRAEECRIPGEFCSVFTGAHALRAVEGAEFDALSEDSRKALFSRVFTVSRQVSRMGVRLDGTALDLVSDGQMASAPVFPGTVQCPEDGHPILLGCDGQTTGGYARIAQVARCDRHLIGQLRPGDTVRLLHRSAEAAAVEFRAKAALLRDWVGEEVI